MEPRRSRCVRPDRRIDVYDVPRLDARIIAAATPLTPLSSTIVQIDVHGAKRITEFVGSSPVAPHADSRWRTSEAIVGPSGFILESVSRKLLGP